jgi:hypothetical protein
VAGRTVEVRSDWYVPAVPDPTLARVYGNRIPDPRVEFAVLTFEYWNQNGKVSRRLLHREALAVVRQYITPENIDEFVRLLVERGDIDDFVELLQFPVDEGGAFRRFMTENGADLKQIRYYTSFYGISPKRFVDGFVLGVAESFATIAIDLWKLVELAARAQQQLFGTAVMMVVDPKKGFESIAQQVAMVGQFIEALMKHLDPTGWPDAVVKKWRDWNEEFAQHLEDMDPWAAGHQLGMIGGNLWQLLTGIAALFKLLRLAGSALMRFAPLLFTQLRRAGARLAAVVAQLTELLAKIGRRTIDGLTQIGYEALQTLFPPKVIQQVKQGIAMIQHQSWTLIQVPQPAFAGAFGGAPMRPGHAWMVLDDSKPVLMAATADAVPAARFTKEAGKAIDETLERLDDVFDPLIKEADLAAAEAIALGKAMGAVEQSVQGSLRALVKKIAWEAFVDLRKRKVRFTAAELGNEVHRRMAAVLPQELKQLAPQAGAAMEKEFRTTVGELGKLTKQMAKALDEPVVDVVARNPELVELLEIAGKSGGKPSPADVAAYCKKHFGWSKTTLVGDLKSDLLIFDKKIKRMVNVDWTSATKLDTYNKLASQVADDLGKAFNGNWDEIAQAYAKAGKKLPEEAKNIAALTNHATRETVARLIAMQEVLKGWRITSHEMTYDGIAKLYKALAGATQ